MKPLSGSTRLLLKNLCTLFPIVIVGLFIMLFLPLIVAKTTLSLPATIVAGLVGCASYSAVIVIVSYVWTKREERYEKQQNVSLEES